MSNKIALITGVSRREGLGYAVARQMAAEGFDVVISARDRSKAEALAAELAGQDLPATAVQLDVTDGDSVEACRAAVEDGHRRLDVLVNNAAGGFDLDQSLLEADLDIARLALEVNFIGPWRMCQALAPLLQRSHAGRIVNVSSGAGSLTSPDGLANPQIGSLIPAYSLSKSALNALTIKMAHAFKGTGVLVNAVCPGETATHPETGDEDEARSPEESARGVVWAATLAPGGPTGGFFRDGRPLPW
jgi:NAD(P)-dependent dehydrogenase (short-subunit alcohol dehydrogenase family)